MFRVHLLNFPGHGDEPLNHDKFSVECFTNYVVDYIKTNRLEQVALFGYSMGGYVAMCVAKSYPDLVDKVITLGTKFNWNEAESAKEIKHLNAETIAQKIPAFAQLLADRHTALGWKNVLTHTALFLEELGKTSPLHPDKLSDYQTPTLLMLGDSDKMVTPEETLLVFRSIKNAQLCIVPQTPHPIEKVNVAVIGYLIHRFLW